MVVEAKEGFQLPIWLPVLVGLIVVFGCGGVYWYFNFSISGLAAQKASLDNKLKDFQTVLSQYETASDDHDYLKAKRDFVQGISSNQHRWIEFMDMLKTKMPKDVWIDKMIIDANGQMKVDGETYSYDSIANFMYRLTKFPQLSGISLDQAASKTQGGSSTEGASVQDSMTKAFKITATSKLNPDAATKTLGLPTAPGAAGRAGVGGGKKNPAAEAE